MELWPAPHARLFTAAFYGLQFDFVVNGQPEEARGASELMLPVFSNNLDRRLAAGGQHL